MATTTKAKPKPKTAEVDTEEYDFDSWSPEKEEQALADLAPKIQHIIVERSFIGRFEDGKIVKLTLDLSVDDIDELEALKVGPTDQFRYLLKKLGSAEVADEFTGRNIAEAVLMAEKYFTILQKSTQATLPE